MARKEEQVLSALRGVLDGIADVSVFREPDQEIEAAPGDRVLVLRDGDPIGEPEMELSGGGYTVEQEARVEAYVAEEDGTDPQTALDGLLADLASALAAAGGLGGLAELVEPQPPREPEAFTATATNPVRGREVPVVITFDTDSLL